MNVETSYMSFDICVCLFSNAKTKDSGLDSCVMSQPHPMLNLKSSIRLIRYSYVLFRHQLSSRCLLLFQPLYSTLIFTIIVQELCRVERDFDTALFRGGFGLLTTVCLDQRCAFVSRFKHLSDASGDLLGIWLCGHVGEEGLQGFGVFDGLGRALALGG